MQFKNCHFCYYLRVIPTHTQNCFSDEIGICLRAVLRITDLVNKELTLIATYLRNI